MYLKKACRKACLNDVTWHTFRHYFRLTAHQKWCGPRDGQGTAWPFVSICDDALAHTNHEAKKRAVELIAGNGAKLVTLPIAR
jgi:hypothetical protein